LESFEWARSRAAHEHAGAAGAAPTGRLERAYPPPPPAGDPGMELNEMGRRIFRRHWRLIALCVGLALAAVLLVGLVGGAGTTYTASARLVLDTQDPKSRQEATAIADWAKGIATAPGQVRMALTHAKIKDRRAADIAKNHVSISSLGTSAVLQLSVSDRDRDVAAKLTNALAERVIQERVAYSNGQLQQAESKLQQRIDKLNSQIAASDVQLDSLAVQLARAASAAQASSLRSQRDGLLQSRDLLLQQRNVAESQQVSLAGAAAQRPLPSIISSATVPAHADSSHLVSYLALGLLLGLIVGIGCAGTIELIRPALVGGDAIARELGIPFLGSLPNEPLARAPRALHTLRARLRLVADAAEVETVGVVPVVEQLDLAPLTELLGGDPMARLSVHQFEPAGTSPGLSGRLGLLAVGPSELEKAEIGEFAQFLTLTPQPVLGLLTYDRRSTNAPHRTPDATEADERRPPGEASQMAKPVAWLVQRVLSWR
jgi:capsular polysaccharide biosynthesis protein